MNHILKKHWLYNLKVCIHYGDILYLYYSTGEKSKANSHRMVEWALTLTGKDTKPECTNNYFLHSSLDDNLTFTGRIHTLWFKTGNVIYVFAHKYFFHWWHVYCYHLNCKLYINCLKLGNLNILIGVTPKLHTLERYLLLSDILAKGLVLNVNRKP